MDEQITQFIVKVPASGHLAHWVTDVINGRTYMTRHRHNAKIYGPSNLAFWQAREGYEIVELPEDERLNRLGSAVAPRLPGF